MSKQRVRFVDAPPPLSGPQDPRAVWMDRLRLLVERPGEWAEVYSGTPSACYQAASALRLRQYHVPPGGWEFTVRSFRRGHLSFSREEFARAILYARFLGADAEAFPSVSAYQPSTDAVWNQHGQRICPVCEETVLPVPGKGEGPYLSMCEACALALAPDVTHGTPAGYKRGCRCESCRSASRESIRSRALRRLSSTDEQHVIVTPAEPYPTTTTATAVVSEKSA